MFQFIFQNRWSYNLLSPFKKLTNYLWKILKIAFSCSQVCCSYFEAFQKCHKHCKYSKLKFRKPYELLSWLTRSYDELMKILLWSPYGIGKTSIFSSCGFSMAALCNTAGHYIFALWFISSSSIFFPCLISAAAGWMFTILRHMAWP